MSALYSTLYSTLSKKRLKLRDAAIVALGVLFTRHNEWFCSLCVDLINMRSDAPDFDVLSCGHSYHSKCYNPWWEGTGECPLCYQASNYVV